MDCYPIVLLILRSSNVTGPSALWEEMLKKTHKELGHLLIHLLLSSNHLHALHCLFCSYAITFYMLIYLILNPGKIAIWGFHRLSNLLHSL